MTIDSISPSTHVDVLIIGAGLSGIGTACQLATHNPNKSFAILERRQRIGGTWDLFRYPGIRSDSDMFTFGYTFRPWSKARVLADGAEIRDYIEDTARSYSVDKHIQYGLQVKAADWSSETQQWAVSATGESGGNIRRFTCNFLVSCTGYYNYDQGYIPVFPGIDDFQGTFIHPQQWPESLDYSGKRVVVIGSGATAVTLVPSMARDAKHITMLQRSPSYIYSRPAEDKVSKRLLQFLPLKWVFAFARWRNVTMQRWLFRTSKKEPERIKQFLLKEVRKQLSCDEDMKHFTPAYNPWDERLCAVPDGALFNELRSGEASVVTGHIECFTNTGIQLKSGQFLEADIVVAATGLQLQMLGGITLSIDRQEVSVSDKMTYKGVLLEDLPNIAMMMGYTNLSWTLKVEVAAQYLSRLFKFMDRADISSVVPHDALACKLPGGMMDSLSSGYVKRSQAMTPRQGSSGPWKVAMDYKLDRKSLLHDPIDDGKLLFTPSLKAQFKESA